MISFSSALPLSEIPSSNSDISSVLAWTRSRRVLFRCVPPLNALKSCHSSSSLCDEGSAITANAETLGSEKARTKLRTLLRRKRSSWILIRTPLKQQRDLINIHQTTASVMLFSKSVKLVEWTSLCVINIDEKRFAWYTCLLDYSIYIHGSLSHRFLNIWVDINASHL